MKRVLTAAVLVPVVLVLVFLPARWQPLFVVATALVSALAAWEYMSLARGVGAKAPRIAVLVSTIVLFLAWWQWQDPEKFISIYGILCIALFIYCTFASPISGVLADAASSIFCLFYTGMTMITIPLMREQANGPSLVLFLLFVVWSGDTAAYYGGRKFGRRKLAPRLSPGKTWEGSIASVLGSMAIAAILVTAATLLQRHDIVVLSYPDSVTSWMIMAVIANVAAQVGDLAESALKRSAGVKDSGSLLPGHGGVLDRIDALLIAAPVLWYAQTLWQRF
jgi:phosphatidate cytidylyltransferase